MPKYALKFEDGGALTCMETVEEVNDESITYTHRAVRRLPRAAFERYRRAQEAEDSAKRAILGLCGDREG